MDEKKFWNRITHEATDNFDQVSLRILEATKFYLSKDDRLLDVGCGNGSMLFMLRDYVNTVSGIDVSDEAIRLAKRKIANARFYEGSIEDTYIEINEYSVITAFNVLHYIGDRERFFTRCHELLTDNGTLIIAVPCIADSTSLVSKLMLFASKLGFVPRLSKIRHDDLKREVYNAGFTLIQDTPLSHRFHEILVVAKKR